MNSYSLQTNLLKVPGIGPSIYLALQKKNLLNVSDLLNYFPYRFEQYQALSAKNVSIGEHVCLAGKVVDFTNILTAKRRLTVQKVTVETKNSKVWEIIFYNQIFLRSVFKKNSWFLFFGKVDFFGRSRVIKAVEYQALENPANIKNQIIGYYSDIKKVSPKFLRHKISYLLKNIDQTELKENLPPAISQSQQLLSPYLSYKYSHFPDNIAQLNTAKKRFAIDELYFLLYMQEKTKQLLSQKKSKTCFNEELRTPINKFISSLPFQLTSAQKKAAAEILTDLSQNRAMNRMLIGDVGSGKTVVMAIAALSVMLSGKKVILLCPTEVLAKQHFFTFQNFFEDKFKVKLTAGKSKQKNTSETEFDVLVTTHAVLYSNNQYDQIGLVIIDEQHKFGVAQRNKILALTKAENYHPHFLSVSATPIPRSLALILYGSLSLSILDEMPKGRLKVKTFLIGEEKRNKGYEWIKKQITEKGSQVFVICPLIDENEDSLTAELKSVRQEFLKLKTVFPQTKIEMLCSQTKNKEDLLKRFQKNEFSILVATSVVEVGLDIQNAHIMLIESAERFGLAQLHQFRGRIGRGNIQSYCFLFSGIKNPEALARIRQLEKINDGFLLAEADLKFRGQGDILGTAQHGYFNFQIELLKDQKLLTELVDTCRKELAKNPQYIYNSYIVKKDFSDKDLNLN